MSTLRSRTLPRYATVAAHGLCEKHLAGLKATAAHSQLHVRHTAGCSPKPEDLRYAIDHPAYCHPGVQALQLEPGHVAYSGKGSLGVVATAHIAAHEVIAMYAGRLSSNSEWAQAALLSRDGSGDRTRYCYEFELIKGVHLTLDGAVGGNVSSFINDSIGSVFSTNCAYLEVIDMRTSLPYVVVVTTAAIAPGKELFVSYGDPFWKRLDRRR